MKKATKDKELILDIINQIQLALKISGVYPEDHPIVAEIINSSYKALANYLKDESTLTISLSGGKILADDIPIESKNNLPTNFAADLNQRAIESITFYRGVSLRDYITFIKAMIQNPRSVSQNEDISASLKKRGVSTIKLNEFKYAKVSKDFREDDRTHPIINAFDLHDPDAALQTDTGLSKTRKHDNDAHVDDHNSRESQKEEKSSDVLKGKDLVADDEKKVNKYINELLSDTKSDRIKTFINNVSSKMDNKSITTRKTVAEGLQNVTSTIKEFDTLKENFEKTSDTLINWLNKEHDVDTYLAVTKSLFNFCSSLNALNRYLINETIGSRLFECNKISKSQLQEALRSKNKNGRSLQYNLAALNLVDESVLTQFLAQQYKSCQVVNLSPINNIPENVLNTMPRKYIERYQILPFKLERGNLHTATMNPTNWQILNEIQFISGYSVMPYLASEYHLLNSIEKYYKIRSQKSFENQAMSNMQDADWNSAVEVFEEKAEPISYSEELKDSDAPIVKLANFIIEEAIKLKASDIHIEPFENELRVRLRIDGTLINVLNPSRITPMV